MKKSLALGGAALLALSLFASAPANADSPTQPVVVDGATVRVESTDIQTPEELTAFIESAVLTVTDNVTPEIATRGVGKTCTTATSCLVASATPYANFSFTGKGDHKGAWDNRKTFKSGPNTAKAWYRYNGTNVGFGPKLGPNSQISVNSPVTAVQVTIY